MPEGDGELMSYNREDYEPAPLPEHGICPKCGKECDVEIEDGRFDYAYGSEEGVAGDCGPVSGCCGCAMHPSDMG